MLKLPIGLLLICLTSSLTGFGGAREYFKRYTEGLPKLDEFDYADGKGLKRSIHKPMEDMLNYIKALEKTIDKFRVQNAASIIFSDSHYMRQAMDILESHVDVKAGHSTQCPLAEWDDEIKHIVEVERFTGEEAKKISEILTMAKWMPKSKSIIKELVINPGEGTNIFAVIMTHNTGTSMDMAIVYSRIRLVLGGNCAGSCNFLRQELYKAIKELGKAEVAGNFHEHYQRNFGK